MPVFRTNTDSLDFEGRGDWRGGPHYDRTRSTPAVAVAKTATELSEGSGRGAVVGKDFFGGDKTQYFRAESDFNHRNRRLRLDIANFHMDVADRDGHHRAIVVVRYAPAVQPFVKRRADFSRRHEQPYEQGQSARRAVEIQARPAIQMKWR